MAPNAGQADSGRGWVDEDGFGLWCGNDFREAEAVGGALWANREGSVADQHKSNAVKSLTFSREWVVRARGALGATARNLLCY